MRVLALEAATEACSVALLDGERLLFRHEELGRGHAERLLPMVDELLREAGLALAGLDALAFGRGPGGFTGVRLATSVAQGLAFGARLPVVPVSTLRAVAQAALELEPAAEYALVCNDARMQEVYWAGFRRGADGLAEPLTEERVGPPGSVSFEWPSGRGWVGAGRGFSAYPDLAARHAGFGRLYDRLLPEARSILRLAYPEVLAGRVVAAHDAQPAYVRNDVARPARRD
jgi:tRNA threonylcarbamoyladenosine biosynthesis protein TsaB